MKTKLNVWNYPTPDVEGTIHYLIGEKQWVIEATRYEGNNPRYTITVSAPDLVSVARQLDRALLQIETQPDKNALMLPDMGDFAVKYFDTG